MSLALLVPAVTTLLDKWIPDKDEAAKLAHEISTMAENHAHEERMMQMKINQTEAQHKSRYVSGWRPFIGWVCGVGLAFNLMVYPVLRLLVSEAPGIDTMLLLTVLGGMLGMGSLRSWEKKQGLARN